MPEVTRRASKAAQTVAASVVAAPGAMTKPSALGAARAGETGGGGAGGGGFVAPTYSLTPDGPGGLAALLETEWLLTNGLGGFAMGTASGVPARRYHGLLVAACKPPVDRVMLLNAMVERVAIGAGADEKSFDLATFRFAGSPPLLHPGGTSRLRSFEQELTCRWTYEIDEAGIKLRVVKEVHVFDRENAVQVRYRVRRLAGDKAGAARLVVRPLTSLRDFHGLIRRNWADRFSVFGAADGARVSFEGQRAQLHLKATGAKFRADAQWWNGFFYAIDADRGQDCVEDLFAPGEFVLEIPAGQAEAECTVQASGAPVAMLDAGADLRRRRERLERAWTHARAHGGAGVPPAPAASLGSPGSDATGVAALIAAADAYVVARTAPGTGELNQTSVIAGYPWFADWGRDTSVSLAGLMLATGRLEDARRTLLAFASHRKNGIVPNVFNDRTGEPEYNTVDASLWFILGACAFRRAGGERAAWDGQLLPACLDIVAHYRRGTDFNIAMDPQDKLITAGTNATQLTWMDARRDGVTFTPRHGKAVEINALWHAALRELAAALRDRDPAAGADTNDLAETVARSFRTCFWNEAARCLYDTLAPNEHGPGWTPVADVRPNQLFAVSLAHSPLTAEQQEAVVACVRERLLTPFGVRTLDPADARYCGRYQGNLFERDRSYHNGTAWPWLLGPYAEAVLRVGGFGDPAKKEARAALEPILGAMFGRAAREGVSRGCVGQIAEIYDGDAPQRPQGCPAQAWSVAEILRVVLMIG